MSTNAYQRAFARDQKIWTPFNHNFAYLADQTIERAIIFGLYSCTINNTNDYLIQVEATELTNILNDYNNKVSKLTADQQITLNDILAKRYVANLDRLIHDNKMITYSQKINAAQSEWEAKVAALAVDQAELVTLSTKVMTETSKTLARIAELNAQIELESYNQSNVDVEILEKQVELAREDVRIMDAANAILKIQTEIVNAALEIIEVDLKVANTEIQIEEMKRGIAKSQLLEKNLSVEQAQTSVIQAEKEIIDEQVIIAQKRTEIAEKEVELSEEMVNHAQDTLTNKILELATIQSSRLKEISDRYNGMLFNLQVKRDAADFDYTTMARWEPVQILIDADKAGVVGYQQWASLSLDNAAIAAAQRAATTQIRTTLTHIIGRS